jgi:23S rRNA (guanine2445-N2)-methyltransferase
MCGSGTLPIEASWIALSRPPGLTRRHFGFQGWMDYDVDLWTELRDTARCGVGKCLAWPIVGSDARRDAVEFARTNARAAGVGHVLRFDVRDVRHPQTPAARPGTVICNPPYGERIGEEKELRALYRTLGELFRRCPGWGVWVFTGNQRLADQIGLPRAEDVPLFNGRIPCRLIRFENG